MRNGSRSWLIIKVSCKHCNQYHNRGDRCSKAPSRSFKKTEESKIRNTRKWRNKSLEIRKRDKGLCQYCLKHGKYSFDNLQVHHIIKLSIDPSKAFNNEWLISLCKPCHDLADAYKIPQQELHEIAVEQENKNFL